MVSATLSLPMRLTVVAALVLLTPALHAAAPATLADRLAAQNALFDESWQTSLRLSPLLATDVGDYRYNDKLDDYSLAAIASHHALNLGYLTRIKAIPTDGFSDQDLISHDLFLRTLREGVDDYDLKDYEMPISPQNGIQSDLADLPNSVPFDSVKHYEDYIARLHQIPRAFLQTEDVLKAGVKDHLVIVNFLAARIPKQCTGIIAANPFLLPIKKFPATFSLEDKQRLTEAITTAVNNEVIPAYKQFSAFVTSDYIPFARTAISIESLPDGKRRYLSAIRRFTTTSLPAAEIHATGLREYDRIVTEMTALATANGYKDLDSFRIAVESDPKYIPHSEQAIVDDFARYIAQMQPKLPLLFNDVPTAPVTVEAIPAFQAASSTHYQTGTADGKRPGRVSVAVSNFATRTLINDEAIAYHEGVPGHHMQRSVQQQLTGLPEFRQHGGNSAYSEGWGLYAEQLGKEVGFYTDPGSDYGRLRSELFRAVRLVVDTGIHDQNWTRDQVVDFMRKSHSIDEPTIQSETDRYISRPAQALSYKLGQLKFRELRIRTQKALGPKFDIRTFHDEMLSGGSLPLDILDARTDRWIEAQLKPTTASAH
jgi:uncharacterized protein (DUF885 family)